MPDLKAYAAARATEMRPHDAAPVTVMPVQPSKGGK